MARELGTGRAERRALALAAGPAATRVAANGRLPHLRFERAFWEAGLVRVAGVDEVGRGALAGPLVAAAVVLPACRGVALRRLRAALACVRESKQLTEEERPPVYRLICEAAAGVGIGVVEAGDLDALGLGAANRLAMERALLALPGGADAALLDACVLDLELPQVGVIDGDAQCLSIAAASVVAKVVRDRVMVEAHGMDPRYAFADHKGYGTAAHQACLDLYGVGPLHRRSFAPVARRGG